MSKIDPIAAYLRGRGLEAEDDLPQMKPLCQIALLGAACRRQIQADRQAPCDAGRHLQS